MSCRQPKALRNERSQSKKESAFFFFIISIFLSILIFIDPMYQLYNNQILILNLFSPISSPLFALLFLFKRSDRYIICYPFTISPHHCSFTNKTMEGIFSFSLSPLLSFSPHLLLLSLSQSPVLYYLPYLYESQQLRGK